MLIESRKLTLKGNDIPFKSQLLFSFEFYIQTVFLFQFVVIATCDWFDLKGPGEWHLDLRPRMTLKVTEMSLNLKNI